jgi:hypothetical protein
MYAQRPDVVLFHHAFQNVPKGREKAEVGRVLVLILDTIFSVTGQAYDYPGDSSLVSGWLQDFFNGPFGEQYIFVFLFDNLHSVSKEMRTELEDRLLRYVIASPRTLTLFFADLKTFPVPIGVPVMPGGDLHWGNARLRKNFIDLAPFALEHTILQLTNLGCTDPYLQKAIHRLSGGVPGANEDLSARTPMEIEERLANLAVEQAAWMLNSLPEHLRPVVPVLSVIGHSFSFSVEEIGDLLNKFSPSANQHWNQPALDRLRVDMQRQHINNIELLAKEDAVFRISEPVCATLGDHVHQTDPDCWRDVHLHMERICQESAEAAMLNERDIWLRRAETHRQAARQHSAL